VLALAACDFAAAEAAAERAQAMGAADEAPYDAGVYGLQMYAIRRAQGRLREVAPVLRVVAATTDPPPMWRPGLAALYAELGMREEARAAFEALAPDRFAAVPRDAVWPACLTFLAETCIALGDRDRASVLFDELAPFANRNLMAGMTICFGPADRLLGGLGVLLRRPDIDEHFAVALDLAERSGSPLWIAEVQYDWARALEVRGEAEGARRLGHQAVITARLLGIGRLAGRPVPGEHAGGEQQAAPVRAPSLPGGLSSREAEVLRLVAAGRSNREIGEALYISQNTAANHVRAILQKTGCANRAEASSYAVRHGLCDR
jgi:DNA-binding CsgD family transcriptional regulator